VTYTGQYLVVKEYAQIEAHNWQLETVLRVLEVSRSLECLDPRDKIYGILGLFKGYGQYLTPDYAKPVTVVYKVITLAMIDQYNSLDVLAHSVSKFRRPGLPSWVPDWSNVGLNPFGVVSHQYEASRGLSERTASVRVPNSNPNVLRTGGLAFDTVRAT